MTRWTRETIIAKIVEWHALYGEPPCSADWNPSLARWRAQEWRIERYREGVWPSTNAAKRPFGGSFAAAVRAAGFEPHRSGPRRRAGAARPDVAQRDPLPPRELDAALLAAAERVRELEARVAELEQAARISERRARELTARLGGEVRQLTTDEIARLRGRGPTGPAVMANALRTLHRARTAGDRRELTVALSDVASAAVGWRDRL